MNRSIRHWKDHKPGDRLVFLKRMLIEGVTFEAGTLVPESIVEKLGKHRLKMWWQARIFRTATEQELPATAKTKTRKPLGKKAKA